MKTLMLMVLGAAMAVALGPVGAGAGTLDDVKSRGVLRCVVSTGIAGFAYPDASGVWKGFDIDFCHLIYQVRPLGSTVFAVCMHHGPRIYCRRNG